MKINKRPSSAKKRKDNYDKSISKDINLKSDHSRNLKAKNAKRSRSKKKYF